ncbi:MAG: hypothetical protein EOO41_02075 [Methanobacteriota archaeon]|nr:MAG: hypothetical protein EOO41_02075 [Euryarchaeota archaeon]
MLIVSTHLIVTRLYAAAASAQQHCRPVVTARLHRRSRRSPFAARRLLLAARFHRPLPTSVTSLRSSIH